jgi:hypothetical protein
MMTEAEFDEALALINERTNLLHSGVEAHRQQEVARLFYRSGWTQEAIANRLGKSQTWVSFALCFGRFPSYYNCNNSETAPPLPPDFNQWRFRQCWDRTDGAEFDRFAEVARLIHEPAPPRRTSLSVPDPSYEPTPGEWTDEDEEALYGPEPTRAESVFQGRAADYARLSPEERASLAADDDELGADDDDEPAPRTVSMMSKEVNEVYQQLYNPKPSGSEAEQAEAKAAADEALAFLSTSRLGKLKRKKPVVCVGAPPSGRVGGSPTADGRAAPPFGQALRRAGRGEGRGDLWDETE